MPAEEGEAPPSTGAPPDVQHATQLAERQQQLTAAGPVALRRRRDAALRLPPLEDGRRDPLDGLAGKPARIVEWGGYDVRTLGLVCAHDEDCPARYREAV
jgi:hypothetical protein